MAAYWHHHELSQGSREQRLAAGAEDWAWEVVESAVEESQSDTLTILDALLAAPEADPCYVGAGPVEQLLVEHGRAWQEAVARRCRTSALWRRAVDCVWLAEEERRRLPLLSDYLPRPVGGPAAPSTQGRRRRTARDVGPRRRGPSRRRGR